MTPTTLKVYVAAISALIGDVSVGCHPLVSCFMKAGLGLGLSAQNKSLFGIF